jgi:3-dehydroquinate dehydratase/shikimate dehydrogenase
MTLIKTARLILRPWRQEDLEPFATLNADPKVMEYFPSVLTSEESNDSAHRISSKIETQRWGLWAVSVPGVADFIGFIGLAVPSFEAPFTPAVEIGWRLAYDHWGKGYATEGAKAVLEYAFETLKLSEVVSFTALPNKRSQHIMEKIGMHHDPKDDFDHPKLPQGHWLKRHVLYRLKKSQWEHQATL